MSEFTPGPWECDKKSVYSLQHYGYNKDGETFCNRFFLSVQDAHTSSEELESNARLISASPDMHAALVAFLSDDPGARRMAVDALAKAEGRE
jgi:hypothetical protein